MRAHLEEAEDKGGLVLVGHRLEDVTVRGGDALDETPAVDVLLDDRVLDVRPKACVREVGLPLGLEVVARAVRRRLRALVPAVATWPKRWRGRVRGGDGTRMREEGGVLRVTKQGRWREACLAYMK